MELAIACLVLFAKSLGVPVEVLPGCLQGHKLMKECTGGSLVRYCAFPWGEFGPSQAQTDPWMPRLV